ncbi:MAG: EAL domain-containing protein, partial [Lachnospiraceae bacterium]|nr:EAL domain-containing protein [Lachnospiraceae bacterium]
IDEFQYRERTFYSSVIFYCLFAFAGVGYFWVGKGGEMHLVSNMAFLGRFVAFCAGFGMAATGIIIFSTFISKKNLPRIVFRCVVAFAALDTLILFLQIMKRNNIIIGICYMIPSVMLYLLFYSNPYDEKNGMQGSAPLNTKISNAITKNKPFVVVFLSIPQMNKTNYIIQEKVIFDTIADIARRVECVSPHSHAFQVSQSNYAMFTPIEDGMEARDYLNRVVDIVDHPTTLDYLPAYYKIVAITNHPFLKNLEIFQHYYTFLQNKQKLDTENEVLFADTSTMTEFMAHYRVHLALEDIRDRKDLNDPRVLTYAQPIYSVEKKSFRSAEALMRLEIDGEILQPNTFIPIAEDIRCIHPLTCVILNKVCRQIKALDSAYDFDCITVNCSAMEISTKSMTDELMHIIESNGIDSKKIRLEITESSMYDNEEVVANNISSMNDHGIRFYLDDFGTGYSNFERLTSGDFQTVKFDKTILYRAMENENTKDLVRSMVEMLKESDIIPLVEGVETEEQKQFSIDNGFDYIQGYNYAKPVPIEELRNYFEKR